MALITRISRLFRADFNAILDRIEEPDVLLKQALREMQNDLYNDEQQLKLLIKKYSSDEVKAKDLHENIEQVNKELDICFESDETELARSQVKRKLEMQRYEKHLKIKLAALKNRMEELKQRLDENKARLVVMQQKFELLSSEKDDDVNNDFIVAISINENEIDMAFLKEKQVRSIS